MGGLERRSRSLPPSYEEESEVLFDACRFPRPSGEFLDCVIGEESWQNAETSDGCKVRIVGDTSALKQLFELPLSAAGEALCLHRVGNCLVVLPQQEVATSDVELLASPRVGAPKCQVRVDGEMVRIFPSLELAEPVPAEMPGCKVAASCEWRVSESLSVLALVPEIQMTPSAKIDLSRTQLQLLDVRPQAAVTFDHVAGSLVLPRALGKSVLKLPEEHLRVTEEKTAVMVVPLTSPLETRAIIDSWLSCCLYGSPSVLCFFVDEMGICRGCRFVLIADLPYLEDIAKAYKSGEQKCLGSPAFDARALRESSHSLLETLLERCNTEGAFLVSPDPLGFRLVAAHEEDEGPRLALSDATGEPPRDAQEPHVRSALVTQGLLLYHAAVRLARTRPTPMGLVPAGARWTAKSCREPLRVRRMMLGAVRALHSASQALPRRFKLLLASAHEFLADSFFAEDAEGSEELAKHRGALSHLQKSKQYLVEYANVADESKLARSVKELEERVDAKSVNAHLSMARLYQLVPWRGTAWFERGAALNELEASEALVARRQPPGPYECSLMASISKWKAEHLSEFASMVLPSAGEVAPEVYEYLEAQRAGEEALPWQTQCERWLQSTVSLCLRAMHQLALVPQEVGSELQLQARVLLAGAYSKLGHLYASTGRFTKGMTHARQGVELFNATKDQLEAAKLQIWLCRLQLRMALPQVPGRGLLRDDELLLGLPGANAAEEMALKQVVQQLQKSLNALDEVGEHHGVRREGQALLGRVLLRQAFVQVAKAQKPVNATSRLCEETALRSALEILQADADSTALSAEATKLAIEKLHQAAACLRAGSSPMAGVAHTCLAYVYYCGRSEQRMLRLALTHCQHALEQGDGESLLTMLLEAKVLRLRKGGGNAGEVKAIQILCKVALERLKLERTETPRDDSSPVHMLLGGDEQGARAYIRQELSSLLLRLLKADLEEAFQSKLKTLYMSLLTAWHSEAGQEEAFVSLLAHLRKLED